MALNLKDYCIGASFRCCPQGYLPSICLALKDTIFVPDVYVGYIISLNGSLRTIKWSFSRSIKMITLQSYSQRFYHKIGLHITTPYGHWKKHCDLMNYLHLVFRWEVFGIRTIGHAQWESLDIIILYVLALWLPLAPKLSFTFFPSQRQNINAQTHTHTNLEHVYINMHMYTST